MSEAIANKDPAIKLFGRTIQLPHFPAAFPADTGDYSSSAGEDELEHKVYNYKCFFFYIMTLFIKYCA